MIRITNIPEENLKFIAQDIGERLMPYFTPEERLEGLTPETVFKNFTAEERFIGLTPEEEKKQLERLAKKYGLAPSNGA